MHGLNNGIFNIEHRNVTIQSIISGLICEMCCKNGEYYLPSIKFI